MTGNFAETLRLKELRHLGAERDVVLFFFFFVVVVVAPSVFFNSHSHSFYIDQQLMVIQLRVLKRALSRLFFFESLRRIPEGKMIDLDCLTY